MNAMPQDFIIANTGIVNALGHGSSKEATGGCQMAINRSPLEVPINQPSLKFCSPSGQPSDLFPISHSARNGPDSRVSSGPSSTVSWPVIKSASHVR